MKKLQISFLHENITRLMDMISCWHVFLNILQLIFVLISLLFLWIVLMVTISTYRRNTFWSLLPWLLNGINPYLWGINVSSFITLFFLPIPYTREPWPLDGVELETLKEQHAKRNPEDLEIDYGTCLPLC